MNIAVLGTGYVGLSTGVCLSEIGHQVTCIDLDPKKIMLLKQGISPIYEPGIEYLIKKNAANNRLHFTTSHQKGFDNAEIIIIAVGTPQNQDGSVNLSYLEQAAIDIGTTISQDTIVVIKSTVPVGTNEYMKKLILDHCKDSAAIEIISNPEFLREGSAIKDTMEADRIIIGYENQRAAKKIKEMYQPLNVPYLLTSIRSAEMIKYASNSFLATKISFINEVANLCEKTGADILEVAIGMGLDNRIGRAFLQAGIGYGGSCFPKDVQAFIQTAKENGIDFSILKETVTVNNKQQLLLIEKASERFGQLRGKKIAMLGLSFKPNTDDMREAPSIKIANELLNRGAAVTAYDPVAIQNAKTIFGDQLQWADNIGDAVQDCDAIFIVTDWKEFQQIDLPAILKSMNQPIIFDGRNCMKTVQINKCNVIEYYPIGRPPIIKA